MTGGTSSFQSQAQNHSQGASTGTATGQGGEKGARAKGDKRGKVCNVKIELLGPGQE